jgi:biotin carboxylase
VKPASLGSSVGVSKAKTRAELVSGLLHAARYDDKILVERAVNAREVEVGVLGDEAPEASVVGEIVPKREFYDYESKYVMRTRSCWCPRRSRRRWPSAPASSHSAPSACSKARASPASTSSSTARAASCS